MAAARRKIILLTILVFVVALIPRVLPRNILTVDETFHWVGRSERFFAAVEAGDWRNTAQAFHPGVATTWLGAAGILLSRILHGADAVQLDYFSYINIVRIPIAVVNALSIVIAYLLLRVLIRPRIAIVAALIWATEPFIVAHSAILHVDALSMSFMTLSLLSGWYALRFEKKDYDPENAVRWRFLVFSAVVGGLAVLTKFTTLFVFPMIAMYSYFWHWRDLRQRPPRPVLAMAIWLLIAGAVWFALYPATWSNMDYVISWLRHGANLALAPHDRGNFFMGQPVEDPGILLYPVAVVLRLTPWAVIGVGLAVVAVFRREFRPYRKAILALLFVVVMYIAVMALQPKKFDRYIIQTFPLLAILAGCGLTWAIDFVTTKLNVSRLENRRAIRLAAGGIAVLVVTFNLAWYHPYYLSYFNPLLGGSSTAVQTLLVGWGEGLEQVAAYVRAHGGACHEEVLGELPKMQVLDRFNPCMIAAGFEPEMLEAEGYVIVYISMAQRQQFGGYRDAISQVEPVYEVNVHGIEYARVYDLATLTQVSANRDASS